MLDGILQARQFHDLANIFPLLEGDNFDQLVDDIKASGLRHPIIELGGAILDGRNRYRACLKSGIEPRFESFTGDDPLAFVISENLHRRHLNESQRAMVAARLANMGEGRPGNTAQICAVSQPEAAEKLSVSRRSVQHATSVQCRGTPELTRRVEQGEVSVSLAAKVAAMPVETQERLQAEPEAKLRTAVKQELRSTRERDLAVATVKASEKIGTTLYNVIYADPPWRFEPYSRDTGLDRAADNHYPTMTLEDIAAIKVPAAPDSVLFLWATAPMLPDALHIMQSWGFVYKSNAVWTKTYAGTGYWFRSKHELLLVGTRGNIPAPAPGTQFESVIELPAAAHSYKPFAFAEMIEEMFPNVMLLEMFARGQREGWDVWGNESK